MHFVSADKIANNRDDKGAQSYEYPIASSSRERDDESEAEKRPKKLKVRIATAVVLRQPSYIDSECLLCNRKAVRKNPSLRSDQKRKRSTQKRRTKRPITRRVTIRKIARSDHETTIVALKAHRTAVVALAMAVKIAILINREVRDGGSHQVMRVIMTTIKFFVAALLEKGSNFTEK